MSARVGTRQVCDLRVIEHLEEPLHLRVRKTPRDWACIESTERVALDTVVNVNYEDNDVDDAGNLECDNGSVDEEYTRPRKYSRRVDGEDTDEEDGLGEHRDGK